MSEKLISADKLIKFVENWGKHRGREEAADSFLYAINNAPAVDAVDVVRCDKCVHWDPITRTKTNGRCRVLMELRQAERYMTEEDYFCKSGERREEDE